ncbi:MAG: rhodanese-like domain-containing protein [Pseudomonas sp.]
MKTAHDLVMAAKTRIHEISPEEAEKTLSNTDVLIDIREADEFQAGHLAGALLIPRGILEFKLSNSPELTARDLKIMLYCKTSGRAALAALSLKEMGYLNVTSIAGGFDAWQTAGKPVVVPALPDFE